LSSSYRMRNLLICSKVKRGFVYLLFITACVLSALSRSAEAPLTPEFWFYLTDYEASQLNSNVKSVASSSSAYKQVDVNEYSSRSSSQTRPANKQGEHK
jgi:hypothetical protein